jgi:thioredoxin-like negative regulator of GroEL
MRSLCIRAAGGVAAVLCGAAWASGEKIEQPSTIAIAEPAVERPAAPQVAPAVSTAKPLRRHGIFEHTSYPAAWTAAQKTNRPILVFATAPSCPHCVRMVGETYRAPQVKELVASSFETVYVDRQEQPALAAKLHIKWYPTTIVVGPDNQVIDVIEGYVDSKTLTQRLRTSMAAHAAGTQKR